MFFVCYPLNFRGRDSDYLKIRQQQKNSKIC
jgi:hypothetical protein